MKETSKTILVLAIAALLAACGGGTGSDAVQAKSDATALPPPLGSAKLCDISGCYVAWNVVDSDKDGVCDADELMAGTDPHDPLSKPSLRVVAELGGQSKLPSFEFGSGAFAVYPEKMQAALQEYYKGKTLLEQIAAFPLAHERGDSLKRAGISAELLKDKGIDISEGFTIGLDRPAADSGMPGRRVGGIEVRLVSDDLAPVEATPTPHKFEGFKDGAQRVTFEGGNTRTTQTDGTVVWRNEDKQVLKVIPGPGKYVNPEADGSGSTEATDEQKKAFERVHGATVLTVDNWEQPEISDEKVKDPRAMIMLVDPLIADVTGMVFDAPRVTTAQPEGVPGMRKPTVPAGGVIGNGPKGGCPVESFTSGDC